jgi:hypothetical protein
MPYKGRLELQQELGDLSKQFHIQRIKEVREQEKRIAEERCRLYRETLDQIKEEKYAKKIQEKEKQHREKVTQLTKVWSSSLLETGTAHRKAAEVNLLQYKLQMKRNEKLRKHQEKAEERRHYAMEKLRKQQTELRTAQRDKEYLKHLRDEERAVERETAHEYGEHHKSIHTDNNDNDSEYTNTRMIKQSAENVHDRFPIKIRATVTRHGYTPEEKAVLNQATIQEIHAKKVAWKNVLNEMKRKRIIQERFKVAKQTYFKLTSAEHLEEELKLLEKIDKSGIRSQRTKESMMIEDERMQWNQMKQNFEKIFMNAPNLPHNQEHQQYHQQQYQQQYQQQPRHKIPQPMMKKTIMMIVPQEQDQQQQQRIWSPSTVSTSLKEEEEEEEEDDQAGGREQSIVRGTESRPTSGQIRNIQHRQASYQHSSTTQPISPVHSINNNNNTNNSNHTNNSNNSGSKEQQQQRLVFPSLVTASKSSSMTNIPAMSMSSSNTETILLPSQLSSEKKMKKKYTVQIHKPSNHNNNNNNPKTAVANDEDTNHRHKKVWKGTIGELGRRYDPIAAAADYARKNPQKAQVNFKVEIGKQENVEDFIEVTKVDPTTANTNTNNNTNTTITEDEKNVPAKPMSKAEVQLSLPVTSWVVSNPLAQAVEAKLLATASGQSQNQPSAVTTKDTHSAATSSSPTRDGGKGGGRGGGGGSAEAAITTNHTTSTIDIAKVLKKSKKQALVLQPLPDVAIKNFRAFTTSMTTYVVLPQVLATLLRFLTINYGNRDWAFRNGLIQEIAEVILDCVSMPRIFEYFVQLIETLYREGFGDPVDNDYFPTGSNNNNNNHNNHHHNNNINDLEDPSMILSHTSQLDAMTAVSAGGNTTSTVANIVFDAISEMSPPVIDPDVIWEKAPYDEHDEEEAKKKKQKQAEELPDAIIIQKIDQDSVRSINAIAPPTKSAPAATGAGAGTVVDASSAGLLNKTPSNGNNTTHNGDSLKKEEGNNNSKDDQEDEKEEGNPTSGKPSYIRMTFNRHAKKSTMKTNEISVEERTAQGYKEYMKMQSYMVHSELVRDLGEFEFESRYVVCPGESVIVALSITAHHVEVSSKERELAKYWIEFWDTHLREYKVWVRKGQDLSGG